MGKLKIFEQVGPERLPEISISWHPGVVFYLVLRSKSQLPCQSNLGSAFWPHAFLGIACPLLAHVEAFVPQ